MYYLIHDCIFIIHVRKNHVCSLPCRSFLWFKLKYATNKRSCTYLCSQRHFHSWCVFSFRYDSPALVGAATKHFSDGYDFSKVALNGVFPLVYLRSHYEAKRHPGFIPKLWFILTLLCTFKLFRAKSLVIQRLSI